MFTTTASRTAGGPTVPTLMASLRPEWISPRSETFRDGLPFYLDDADVDIEEQGPGDSQPVVTLRVDQNNSTVASPASDAMAIGWVEHPASSGPSAYVQADLEHIAGTPA